MTDPVVDTLGSRTELGKGNWVPGGTGGKTSEQTGRNWSFELDL